MLESAHACIDGSRARRIARPASEWEALRCVLACRVPAPGWIGQVHLRVALDKLVLAAWGRVLATAGRVRTAWQEATSLETKRRADLDAIFGVARLVMRAWREYADRRRAGVVQWQMRWQRAGRREHGLLLAQRLTFSNLVWSDECVAGESIVWLMLQYQRLVRAGGVAQRRLLGAVQQQEPASQPAASTRDKRARECAEQQVHDEGGVVKRQRRHDGQLRYGVQATARMLSWAGGQPAGDPRPPFGDG